MYYVYVLEYETPLRNGNRFYCGMTINLQRRLKQHEEGQGSYTTRFHGVKRLVFTKEFPTKYEARAYEDYLWACLRQGWDPTFAERGRPWFSLGSDDELDNFPPIE